MVGGWYWGHDGVHDQQQGGLLRTWLLAAAKRRRVRGATGLNWPCRGPQARGDSCWERLPPGGASSTHLNPRARSPANWRRRKRAGARAGVPAPGAGRGVGARCHQPAVAQTTGPLGVCVGARGAVQNGWVIVLFRRKAVVIGLRVWAPRACPASPGVPACIPWPPGKLCSAYKQNDVGEEPAGLSCCHTHLGGWVDIKLRANTSVARKGC